MARRYEYWVQPPTEYHFVSLEPITSGEPQDFVLPQGATGLLVGTAGVQDVTHTNGEDADALPLQQGFNPGFFSVLRINPINTAANIWAKIVATGLSPSDNGDPVGPPDPVLPGREGGSFSHSFSASFSGGFGSPQNR